MGKADELLRSMGGTITESASRRGTPAAMPAAPAGATLAGDRLAGVARSKAALDIPPEKIEPDPDQPREEFDEEALARLADSVRARGVLQPIRVRWDEGRGRYVIICGERRWRAARLAGLAAIPCVVAETPATPGELLAIQLVENALREDLKPVEQARAFRALLTVNNWSGNQLAKELGISQSSVVQALALLDLPAAVQERVEQGALPASSAYAIAALDDPAEQAEVAALAVAGGLNRAEVVRAVRSRAGGPASPKGRRARARKVTARTIRVEGGARVTVENRRGLDAAGILAALRGAVARIEAELAEGRGEAA